MKILNVSLLFLLSMPISLTAWSKNYERPQRHVSIILTEAGYFPDHVVAKEGDEVRFFVTSTMDKPECLIVEDHKIFLAAEKGKINETSQVFSKAGKYKFYCPSTKYQGTITILGGAKREVASEKPTYWLPRDYD